MAPNEVRQHIEAIILDSLADVNDVGKVTDRIMGVVAETWDEGFNAGHYGPSEEQECDCRQNPHREEK